MILNRPPEYVKTGRVPDTFPMVHLTQDWMDGIYNSLLELFALYEITLNDAQ